MRNQHLQLEDFALARLHVDWNPVEAPSKAVEQNISITCKIAQSEARPGLFMLKLELQINSIASQPKPPYEVAAHIMGSFFVPGEAGKGEMARRVVLSGGAILLGILRGEIAAITGSFPPGKFVLPAINIPEALKQDARRKAGGMVGPQKKAKSAARRGPKSTN